MRTNPYLEFVKSFEYALTDGRQLPLGKFRPPKCPVLSADAPTAIIFSPHPDDECIIGAMPLRLRREFGMRVINVAVTLGSNKDRRAARLSELQGACAFLGFDLVLPKDGGLEEVNQTTRRDNPTLWMEHLSAIANIIKVHKPKTVFFPHANDWHPTHIGTYYLVTDALRSLAFSCTAVETEYWAPMACPNVLFSSTTEEVADLVAGLSFHIGEVSRNQYHLRLPAWMADNVRRGSELIAGQGAVAKEALFATLYKSSQQN